MNLLNLGSLGFVASLLQYSSGGAAVGGMPFVVCASCFCASVMTFTTLNGRHMTLSKSTISLSRTPRSRLPNSAAGIAVKYSGLPIRSSDAQATPRLIFTATHTRTGKLRVNTSASFLVCSCEPSSLTFVVQHELVAKAILEKRQFQSHEDLLQIARFAKTCMEALRKLTICE